MTLRHLFAFLGSRFVFNWWRRTAFLGSRFVFQLVETHRFFQFSLKLVETHRFFYAYIICHNL